MQNIIIVTDSTSAISKEEQETYQIENFPLNIMIGHDVYQDQIDITNEQFYKKLEEGCLPTSSQPSLGLIEERMKAWQEQGYDAIIILTISSRMSGTYHNFELMREQLQMKNVYIIDSKVVGPVIKEGAIQARKWVQEGYKIDEICYMVRKKFDKTTIFLLPHDMTYLKRSGRITPVAASMASLLKIKPVLLWRKDGSTVDKYGTGRTLRKSFQMVIDYCKEQGIKASTHHIYVLHARGESYVAQLLSYIKEQMGDISTTILDLPSILTCHAGLRCICVVITPRP